MRALAQRIRESLFVIPALVIAGAAGLSRLAAWADSTAGQTHHFPLLLSSTVAGARSILSTVAGATITVAAIVFAMTTLAIQLASSQYSPRILAGFFRDPFQQWVTGLVVGTFTFALLGLAGLGAGTLAAEVATPSATMTLGVALGLASLVGIVAYIDHSTRRMRIEEIVRRIGLDTLRSVERTHVRPREDPGDTAEERSQPEGEGLHAHSARAGWVQHIDGSRLAVLLPPGGVARVEVRTGELVSVGDTLVTAWPPPDDGGRLVRRLRGTVRVGRYRTLDQDPAFGIRQLVDIALRALSPGINDPTTAMDVLQHLKVPLREVLMREAPVRVFRGPHGQRVFLPEAYSRTDHVTAAFREIRLAASNQPAVLRVLVEVVGDLVAQLQDADLESRAGALVEQARLAVAAARSSGIPDVDVEPVVAAATRRGLLPEEG